MSNFSTDYKKIFKRSKYLYYYCSAFLSMTALFQELKEMNRNNPC